MREERRRDAGHVELAVAGRVRLVRDVLGGRQRARVVRPRLPATDAVDDRVARDGPRRVERPVWNEAQTEIRHRAAQRSLPAGAHGRVAEAERLAGKGGNERPPVVKILSAEPSSRRDEVHHLRARIQAGHVERDEQPEVGDESSIVGIQHASELPVVRADVERKGIDAGPLRQRDVVRPFRARVGVREADHVVREDGARADTTDACERDRDAATQAHQADRGARIAVQDQPRAERNWS